jgi:hypothetical protein
MFKNFKMMIVLTSLLTIDVQASLQVAIAARDFCAGNSLVLIARDGNGCENVAGYVSLDNEKTEFSQEEISVHNPTLLSVSQQKSIVVSDVNQDEVKQNDEALIYLYFAVDPKVNIVRVLMIKNNFLADNPFDVVEFSATSILDVDEEDDDFNFDMQDNDELSHLNLTDIQGVEPVHLSNYNKMVLGLYALWAVQSSQVKQTYKNISSWFSFNHAE